jgi:hypothetical protein
VTRPMHWATFEDGPSVKPMIAVTGLFAWPSVVPWVRDRKLYVYEHTGDGHYRIRSQEVISVDPSGQQIEFDTAIVDPSYYRDLLSAAGGRTVTPVSQHDGSGPVIAYMVMQGFRPRAVFTDADAAQKFAGNLQANTKQAVIVDEIDLYAQGGEAPMGGVEVG